MNNLMTMPILILPISVKMLTLGDTVKYKVLCWVFYLKSQFIPPQSSFLFKLKKKSINCANTEQCVLKLCACNGVGVGSGIGCEGRALPLVKVTIL